MKPRPNHRVYLRILRAMTPDERLRKAFELSELSRTLFRDGLRARFPDMPEDELKRLYIARLRKSQDRTD